MGSQSQGGAASDAEQLPLPARQVAAVLRHRRAEPAGVAHELREPDAAERREQRRVRVAPLRVQVQAKRFA